MRVLVHDRDHWIVKELPLFLYLHSGNLEAYSLTADPVYGVLDVCVCKLWFDAKYVSARVESDEVGCSFAVALKVLDLISSKAREGVLNISFHSPYFAEPDIVILDPMLMPWDNEIVVSGKNIFGPQVAHGIICWLSWDHWFVVFQINPGLFSSWNDSVLLELDDAEVEEALFRQHEL
jgi:hypothetical protein